MLSGSVDLKIGCAHLDFCSYSDVGPTGSHTNKNKEVQLSLSSSCYVFGIFSGRTGVGISSYFAQHFPKHLQTLKIHQQTKSEDIKTFLTGAFCETEAQYFQGLISTAQEKNQLRKDLRTEGESSRVVNDKLDRLQKIEERLGQTCSASIVLVINGQLYTANIGTSAVLICEQGHEGKGAQVSRYSASRLNALGQQTYNPSLKKFVASKPPTVDLQGPIELGSAHYFALVVSPGILKALEVNIPSSTKERAKAIDADLCRRVVSELPRQRSSPGKVAETILRDVAKAHRDVYDAAGDDKGGCSSMRDDMTLLIKSWNDIVVSSAIAVASSSKTQVSIPPVVPGRADLVLEPIETTLEVDDTTAGDTAWGDFQGSDLTPTPPHDTASMQTNPFLANNSSHISGTDSAGQVTPTASSGPVKIEGVPPRNEINTEDSDSGSMYLNQSFRQTIQLDAQGKIEPYVNFGPFYEAMGGLSREEVDALQKAAAVRMDCATIPEGTEPTTPISPDVLEPQLVHV